MSPPSPSDNIISIFKALEADVEINEDFLDDKGERAGIAVRSVTRYIYSIFFEND